MNRPASPILPGFPNTKPFKELRFHLRELYWDLTRLVKEVETLSAAAPDVPQAFQRIRYELIDITSGLEHTIFYHLAETLKLAGQVLEKPSLTEVGTQLTCQQIDWDTEQSFGSAKEQHKDVNKLYIDLHELASKLSLAWEKADRAVRSQGGEPNGSEQLERALEQLFEILDYQIWLKSQQLYLQAVQLHRTTDPVQAAQEDYWQLLATPLQEESHPLARRLNSCPRCGASLTQEDRTFDGSFCEFCRTRWIESTV